MIRVTTIQILIDNLLHKPSILFKDFKNRPLVNNTTKDKNKELV